jgi:hypothetical protein
VAQFVEAEFHAGRSRFRFPMGSLEFFIELLLPVVGRTMAMGSTQPLNISLGKDGRCIGLTTLSPSRADCLNNSGSINLLETSGPV